MAIINLTFDDIFADSASQLNTTSSTYYNRDIVLTHVFLVIHSNTSYIHVVVYGERMQGIYRDRTICRFISDNEATFFIYPSPYTVKRHSVRMHLLLTLPIILHNQRKMLGEVHLFPEKFG